MPALHMNDNALVPAGTAISTYISAPDDVRWESAREVLWAVDRVHGDGLPPLLEIGPEASRTDLGGYRYTARTGQARGITTKPTAQLAHFTLAHEIGHLLDHQALGVPGQSSSPTPQLAPLMTTIGRSISITQLTRRRGKKVALITNQRGVRIRETIDQHEVERLLRPEEQFARAYAQYIAVRSGDAKLLHQLAIKRGNPFSHGLYYEQWSDDDFAPIAMAFDSVLLRKGWVQRGNANAPSTSPG